jgi:hypothetical protein
VFDTAEGEQVLSVEHIGEDTENGQGNRNGGQGARLASIRLQKL